MPVQPLIDGVIVIVALTGESPRLIATNEGISPVPDAPRPMAGFELLQLKLAPEGVPE